MSEAARGPQVDYVTLAEFLVSLGSPVRLEILNRLRFPHTLSELRIRPHRKGDGETERSIARQSVQRHLNRLVEMGLVNVQSTERGGRQVPEYVVNPSRLYALTEDLRTLSTLYAGLGTGEDATGTMGTSARPTGASGARLVLVHGVFEGRPYPLDAVTATDGSWLIGRASELAVPLTYDPYVSTRNTEVYRRRGRFVVRDLESKNGTRVNWVYLSAGGEQVLEPGDVIGVGRSLLSFVAQ